MQHAAIMALVFAVCIYTIFLKKIVASVHFFFILFFSNLVLINQRNGPQYHHVLLALCVFFNRGDMEGTNSWKMLCSMFVYVLFYANLCHCQD